ncbi:class I glutamine amidotransferase-like protein [Exidia glandulosa HHB12029]|uniref:Class I glutamine amidotransferase-like protein n=1 Tax=Exidia glandulosa HHB12029 TaxID=1314781 RepID=A0A166BNW0_EXIGL|nr:class I glutamine amidotransferase-like protein [Exidia glandulosa HHB12029]
MADSKRILICMADNGQDPTECAIPWKRFTEAGYAVDFATENGAVPSADQLLVKGSLFKSVLGPKQAWTDMYHEMSSSPAFQAPHSWSANNFTFEPYAAVIFPGGHDKPIRQYLESPTLHALLQSYWPQTDRFTNTKPRKVVGAICHGVLVPAFAGLLHDVETTTLPQWLESLGQGIGSLWGRGQYYRTYPDRWTFEDVLKVVKDKAQYKKGPVASPAPFAHTDPKRAYVSARWPGDAELFAQKVMEEIKAAQEETKKVQTETQAASASTSVVVEPEATAA